MDTKGFSLENVDITMLDGLKNPIELAIACGMYRNTDEIINMTFEDFEEELKEDGLQENNLQEE